MRAKDACEFASALKAWLDGELLRERAAQVEEHVAGCTECRASAAVLREVSCALKFAEQDAPRPPRLSTILQRVRTAQREEAVVVGFLQRLAAVAAAILVVSLAALLWKSGPNAPGDPDVAWRDNVMEIVLSDAPAEEAP
jgi:anti-sigma factor RsiW